MSAVRQYKTSARNPLILGGALACFAMAAVAQSAGASPAWLVALGLPGVAILAAWFQARRGGWSVSNRQVRFYVGNDWELRLLPEQIAHASRIAEPEGPDGIQIALTNGQTREVPDQCVGRPDALLDALEDVGVDVRSSL